MSLLLKSSKGLYGKWNPNVDQLILQYQQCFQMV
jgi:hypothetical protein